MKNIKTQFDIRMTIEEDTLLINASGSYSLTKAKKLFKASVDSALLGNASKILLDVTNITGSIPFLDRFDYAEFLSQYLVEHALDRIRKIAVTGHEPIVHNDRFGELVAVNRGANVKVFTDINEASIWLKSE